MTSKISQSFKVCVDILPMPNGRDVNRFDSPGEMIEAIYRHIHYYNHQRIHTVLKMPPASYAIKIYSDNVFSYWVLDSLILISLFNNSDIVHHSGTPRLSSVRYLYFILEFLFHLLPLEKSYWTHNEPGNLNVIRHISEETQ